MNRENLKLMADYIETIPQEKFDMERFRTGEKVKHKCNSVGCILGHCTVLNKNPLPLYKSGNIDFYAWSKEFTGLDPDSSEWAYLFASEWEDGDNTPTGAAKRIRYLLENGLPEDLYKQMHGRAPISYLTNQTK